PAEDLHHNVEFLLVFKDLFHGSGKSAKRTIHYLHGLTLDEGCFQLDFEFVYFIYLTENPVHLRLTKGYRLLGRTCTIIAQEANYTRYIIHRVIGLTVG